MEVLITMLFTILLVGIASMYVVITVDKNMRKQELFMKKYTEDNKRV